MSNNEIAKVDPMMSELLGSPRVWTSLDLAVFDNKMLLAQAMLPTAPKLEEVVNTTIKVFNLVVQSVEGINDESGEVEQYAGITLICDDDKMYWTGSNGVRKSIHSMFLWAGQPPWKDGIEVRVISRSFTRKDGKPGRSYYLEPVKGKKDKAK